MTGAARCGIGAVIKAREVETMQEHRRAQRNAEHGPKAVPLGGLRHLPHWTSSDSGRRICKIGLPSVFESPARNLLATQPQAFLNGLLGVTEH